MFRHILMKLTKSRFKKKVIKAMKWEANTFYIESNKSSINDNGGQNEWHIFTMQKVKIASSDYIQ